jgi:hypothetical protein
LLTDTFCNWQKARASATRENYSFHKLRVAGKVELLNLV